MERYHIHILLKKKVEIGYGKLVHVTVTHGPPNLTAWLVGTQYADFAAASHAFKAWAWKEEWEEEASCPEIDAV